MITYSKLMSILVNNKINVELYFLNRIHGNMTLKLKYINMHILCDD